MWTGDDQLFQGKHAHQVRSAAFSWVLKGGVSLLQLFDAWFGHKIFSSRFISKIAGLRVGIDTP